MNPRLCLAAGLLISFCSLAAAAPPRKGSVPKKTAAPKLVPKPDPAPSSRTMSAEEARMAVAMLNDAYQLILEKTHATYPTRPNQPVAAAVVRQVQERMNALGWPKTRFLAVNSLVMHQNHQPRDEFERRSVEALRAGEERLEEVGKDRLRVSEVVFMGVGCSSCHWVPAGKTNIAAITFTVPFQPEKVRPRQPAPAGP